MTTPPPRELSILAQATNAPNLITLARLVVAIGVFAMISAEWYLAALIAFAIAAGTDWVDGWLARSTGQVSKLGRILDPFCDKFLICGTFVYLAAIPGSGVAAWMAVVVLSRELFVTALRSVIESEGGDFSAAMSGKLKMVFQCAAAIICLAALWRGDSLPEGDVSHAWLGYAIVAAVWLAVVTTIWSGLEYAISAARTLSRPRA